jgi:dihydroxyacetone kinase-like predicted kinase
MMLLQPEATIEANVDLMERSLSQVKTGEITRATRTVELDGVDVKEGSIIGLVDGKLRSSGSDENEVVDDVLEKMEVAGCGIVTIYYGADVSIAQAAGLAERIRSRYPDVEVEVVEGGQAHYFYILGAE